MIVPGVNPHPGQVLGPVHPGVRSSGRGSLPSEGPDRAPEHPEGLPMLERAPENGDSCFGFCSTAVEHAPHNQEVVSLNTPVCWTFSSTLSFSLSLILSLSGVSLISSLKEVQRH